MDRTNYVLAVLAGAQGEFTPVQLQKLFFILDKKGAAQLRGPYFNFKPYNYGPFDPAVYHEVDALGMRGLAVVDGASQLRRYGISIAGLEAGKTALASLPPSGQQYIVEVGNFVRSKSFAQLVSAVYAEWPEMKANSIFRD